MTAILGDYLKQDLCRVCMFVSANALLCNFAPPAELLAERPRLRYAYEMLLDIMAGFALNWRERLPSLDREFPGFRRMMKHAYRNWRQDRSDELEKSESRRHKDLVAGLRRLDDREDRTSDNDRT